MTPAFRPAPDAALELLRRRFLNRTDHVAVLTEYGKPRPVEANGTLDALLRGHLLGEAAPPTKVRYQGRRGGPGAMTGRFRVGSYCPGPDNLTRWLCLDFDGQGHALALADPAAAARAALAAFEAAGVTAHLERSGGGKGWHVWCFFDPPIAAAQARALGHAMAPKDAPLVTGAVADPSSGRGIEVFPKQPRITKKGFGNLVWLPWWSGAPEGANVFYRVGTDGALAAHVPDDLAVAAADAVERALAALPPPARRTPARTAAPSRDSTPSGTDPIWAEWRKRAVAALPLDAVYGPWLTGERTGDTWLGCRDPSSPTGDRNPSAGVADGTGEAERGSFHSFLSGKNGSVFDFLMDHGGCADFLAARARVAELSGVPLPVVPPRGPAAGAARRPRKPTIVIRTEEHEVIDEAVAALARVDGVYCRGTLLVHVVRDASPLAGIIHPANAARIAPLSGPGVRDRLTLAADWIAVRQTSDGPEEVPAHPPAWAAPAVEARLFWPGMRYLEGVVESPVLRPDGTLLEEPGYDQATGLLYVPNAEYPRAPAAPTREDAVAAAAEVLDAVCDFPFRTEAHRAAWLASVLTPLARYAFRGPAPLFLMDANVRSAGKSLLADVTGEIVMGRQMARTPQASDETEEVKRITAIALAGDRVVLLDNISRPLGSGALDAVLTGTVWSDRILGKSEKVTLPLLTVWYASGNNVTLKADTARRCLHIRLESDMEKPEYRAGFKYPKLLAWANANRARLVVAALTILRAYCVAGQPDQAIRSWGSFEGWSALVRAAVVWCGLADPGETRAELEEVDTDANVLADLIAGWEELPDDLGSCGATIAQAIEVLRDDDGGRGFTRLRAALAELAPHPPTQLPTARKVGYALRRFRGRVVGGRRLQTRVYSGNRLWFVEAVGGGTAAPTTPSRPPVEVTDLLQLA